MMNIFFLVFFLRNTLNTQENLIPYSKSFSSVLKNKGCVSKSVTKLTKLYFDMHKQIQIKFVKCILLLKTTKVIIFKDS